MKKLISRMEAARLIGVTPGRIDRWANHKRIRVLGRIENNKPIFTIEAIEEIIRERKKDPQRLPSIKDDELITI